MNNYIEKLKTIKDNQEGFSLIELVVAVGILAILSVVGVVAYSKITENARKTAVEAAAAEVYKGAVAYDSNGDDYKQAAVEWKNSAGNSSIEVEVGDKNSAGEFCVVATMGEPHNITANKGAGCKGSGGSENGGNGDVENTDSPIVGSIENCEVVDGTVVINSENIQELASTIETEFTNAGITFDQSVGYEGALGSVADAFELNEDIPPFARIQAVGGTVGHTGLDTALEEAIDSVLAPPLVDSNELVSIDLPTGVITINGSTNCSEVNKSDIDAAIAEALGTLSTRANDAFVSDVLNNVGLVIEISGRLSLILGLPQSANVDIVVETTLGQLAGTAEGEPTIDVDGSPFQSVSIETLKNTVSDPINDSLIEPSSLVVADFVDTTSDNMKEGIDEHVQEIIEGDKW